MNLVIGTIKNYDWSDIQPFMVSLQKSGYTGKTALFYNNINSETLETLKSFGVTLIPFQDEYPYLEEQYTKDKGIITKENSSNQGIFSARHLFYYLFLKNTEEHFENVMITDVRDVVFQGDPFSFPIEDKLCCFLESKEVPIKDSLYNADGIRNAFGEEVLQDIGDNTVCCAGVTIGNRDNIISYLEKLLSFILNPQGKKIDDQVVLNYLVWHENMPNIQTFSNNSGPVLTLGYEKRVVRNTEGKIVNTERKVPLVVHQYDRHYLTAMRYYDNTMKSRATKKEIKKQFTKVNDYVSKNLKSRFPHLHHTIKSIKNNQFSFTPHPSSTPFISGDTFRNIADHVYDETSQCHAPEIKNGDIVFIKTDFLQKFFNDVDPLINAEYKIITHNSDINITEKEASFISSKVIRWFGQNILVSHPKITPLPIGLENASYYKNGIVKNFLKAKETIPVKKNRILFGFSTVTNPTKRGLALTALQKSPVADEIQGKVAPAEHLKLLKSYKFVAAPEGNGVDTHRLWEALILDTIPVCTSNPVVEHFKSLGAPIHIINSWEDIEHLSETDLEKIYAEMKQKYFAFKDNLISYDYWQGIIRIPEEKKDEAIVCVALGESFNKKYEKEYKPSHSTFAFNIRRPLIVIKDYIQKVDKRPTWQKLVMFRTPILSGINRVMLLDADIYVKNNFENPLDAVPIGHWGLAPNNAFSLPTLAVTDLILYEQCPPENRPSFVLNCGFFIVNRNVHQNIMEYVFEHYGEQPCDEQGPFCYHLINEFQGTILPYKFNNIVPSYVEKYGYSMTTLVNMFKESNLFHFAGKGGQQILKIVRIFDTHPFVFSIISSKAILPLVDTMSHIRKKIKKI